MKGFKLAAVHTIKFGFGGACWGLGGMLPVADAMSADSEGCCCCAGCCCMAKRAAAAAMSAGLMGCGWQRKWQ
eukprot:1157579-Pelagomonas_calceolata.AAC.5